MGQLAQAAAIAIIGGADGVTSIYVSAIGARGLAPAAILFAALFGLAIFGLIRGIRKRSKARVIFFGLICAVFAVALFAAAFVVCRRVVCR